MTKQEVFEFLEQYLELDVEHDYDGSVYAKLVLIHPETGGKHNLGRVLVKESDYDG